MQLDLRLVAQRHTEGRATYVPPRDVIDPASYAVEEIANEAQCKPFVLRHHYSASFPAAICSFGLFEASPARASRLVGIACFSVPMNALAEDRARLAAGEATCELGRFVLTDEVGCNAESYFLRRALRGLAASRRVSDGRGGTAPKYPIVVSFSDPVPRVDAQGRVTFRGHYGHAYGQASHATYRGRGSPKTMWSCRDGSALVARTLNKLRNGESGAGHVYRLLASHGAPAIRPGEGDKDYVARALRDGPFRALRHKGNHRFAWATGTHARRKALRAAMDANLPYPTHTDMAAG